jgi:hypothetical protein
MTKSAVELMELEERFFTEATVQLTLTSKNPEDIYTFLNSNLEAATPLNHQTGNELSFEIIDYRIETLTLVSEPDEEEMYIDVLRNTKEIKPEYGVDLINEATYSDLTQNGIKELYVFSGYRLNEGQDEIGKSYFLINTVTSRIYQIHLETCFDLLSQYLDEEDREYILLDEMRLLECKAV